MILISHMLNKVTSKLTLDESMELLNQMTEKAHRSANICIDKPDFLFSVKYETDTVTIELLRVGGVRSYHEFPYLEWAEEMLELRKVVAIMEMARSDHDIGRWLLTLMQTKDLQ